MRIRLISVGRDRSGLFEPAVKEYAGRLAHYCKFELLELPEAKKARDPRRAMEEEAETILSRLRPGEILVALDERGRGYSSQAFADQLAKLLEQGRDIAFVIGGAEGLAEAVRQQARLVVSLSPMTLPHRLARVVLAEQLYRAFTLLRNEPYHR